MALTRRLVRTPIWAPSIPPTGMVPQVMNRKVAFMRPRSRCGHGRCRKLNG